MNIDKKIEQDAIIVSVEGRIDTTTAPMLNTELVNAKSDTDQLILDLNQTAYISSAGLRVILKTHKDMKEKNGSFRLIGVGEEIMEIFEMTGFLDFLNVERK